MQRLTLPVLALFVLLGCNVSDDGPSVNTNGDSNANVNNCTGDECDLDCAGTPGGTATEDACGVCDDDPTNDCVVDCAGTPGGDATEDPCGVCDTDPENDCVIDCEGTPGGDAYEDECGVCDSEPQNDCRADCAGVFGGDAYEDSCGVCDADPGNDCVEDCEGTANGDAVLDFCGRCTGGTTGRLACDVLEFTVVADATVDTTQPDTTLGGESTADTDADSSYAYFEYEMASITDEQLIYNAELVYHALDGAAGNGDGTTYVEYLPGTIDESAITWNNQPDATPELLGTFDATNAVDGNERFTFGSSELISKLTEEAASDKRFLLRLRSPGYGVRYFTKESNIEVATLRVGVVEARQMEVEPLESATVIPGSDETVRSSTLDVFPSSRATSGFNDELGFVLKFDISSLPENAQIERVFVSALARSGFAFGGNGNVYTYLLDQDTWTSDSVSGNTVGALAGMERTTLMEPLGYWWLWYNRDESDKLGVNGSLKLVPAVQQEFDGDQMLTFYFASGGYETHYYTHEDSNPAKRPKLRILYTIPGQ